MLPTPIHLSACRPSQGLLLSKVGHVKVDLPSRGGAQLALDTA
jgi:hypothetical protein